MEEGKGQLLRLGEAVYTVEKHCTYIPA